MKTIRAWYFSAQRVLELVHDKPSRVEITRLLESAKGSFAGAVIGNLIGRPMVEWIEKSQIQPFHKLVAVGSLKIGTIFTYDGHFFGKGFGLSNKSQLCSLSENVDAYYPAHKLVLEFGKAGITTDTAYSRLSGSTSLFALCVVTKIEFGTISAIPVIVGDLIDQSNDGIDLRIQHRLKLNTLDVDQFKTVDFLWNPTPGQFNKMKGISELTVKTLFCRLLGEIDVPKDWGGEEADIFSGNMTISGRRYTSAFLLKGPAQFHEMTLADCGKNADQIYRLFNTPAEVFVIQHCHKIPAAVRRTVEAFASAEYSRECRYLIIDGYDTCRILHSNGLLS